MQQEKYYSEQDASINSRVYRPKHYFTEYCCWSIFTYEFWARVVVFFDVCIFGMNLAFMGVYIYAKQFLYIKED